MSPSSIVTSAIIILQTAQKAIVPNFLNMSETLMSVPSLLLVFSFSQGHGKIFNHVICLSIFACGCFLYRVFCLHDNATGIFTLLLSKMDSCIYRYLLNWNFIFLKNSNQTFIIHQSHF